VRWESHTIVSPAASRTRAAFAPASHEHRRSRLPFATVSYLPLPLDWSVVGLLRGIATAQPAYNALIDTGALVTGLSNLQVAKALLSYGLAEVEAVVFLDELDRKMALLRKGAKVVALAECGVALEKRFSFYDQVRRPCARLRTPTPPSLTSNACIATAQYRSC
jgi:hypothetical protein